MKGMVIGTPAIPNKKIIFVSLLFFYSIYLHGQSYNKLWDKTYGGDSREWNCTISTDAGGNIFLTGDSQSDISGDKTLPLCNTPVMNADVWLMKIDTDGIILWQRTLGGEGDERSPRLFHLNNPNKEILMACFSMSDSACDKTEPNRDTVPLLSPDYWICLLDSNGNVIWNKTLGGDNYDDQTLITVTASGEILVCGESNSPVGYDKTVPNYTLSNDLWTLKLDPAGSQVVWDRVYGGDGAEYLAALLPDPDGSFLIAGSTNSDISGDVSETPRGNLDYWLVKVDDAGNKIWDKRFGGSGPDRCYSACRTPDNGYVLSGFTVSPQDGDVTDPPKGIQDFWVVKTDSAGNKIWDKRFGGNNGSFGTHVSPASGGYWVGGYTNSDDTADVSEPPYGGSDYWFLKIDENGSKIWDKRLGGSGDDFLSTISHIADSTFMVFGYSDSGGSAVKTAPGKGWMDYWLVKYHYADSTTGIRDVTVMESQIEIFPNPASADVTLSFTYPKTNELEWVITDMTGRIQARKSFMVNPGIIHTRINCHSLSSGLYQVAVWDKQIRVGTSILSIIK